MEELSEPDRAQLFALLDGHPLIVADDGLAGTHSFSLLDQQPMLLFLCGLYLALMVFCPVILPRNLHDVSGSELSLASALLALSFPLLDAVRDLYGQRRARQLLWFSVVVLLGMAGLYGLQQNYLAHLVTGNHEGAGHSHNLVAMDDFYHDFPQTYVLLALALWLADSLNTLVFGKIGGLKKGGGIFQHFAVRSLLSAMLAQLAFMPLAGYLLQAAFLHDARFFSFRYFPLEAIADFIVPVGGVGYCLWHPLLAQKVCERRQAGCSVLWWFFSWKGLTAVILLWPLM